MNRINTNKRAGKLAIFLFFTFLSLTTIAQNKDKKITIQNKNISLKEAFAQIETQTGYSIAYEQSNLNIEKKHSLSFKNVTIDKAMAQLLKETGYVYKIKGYHIIISSQDNKQKPANNDTQKLTQTIRGIVVDSKTNTPIEYASVCIAEDPSRGVRYAADFIPAGLRTVESNTTNRTGVAASGTQIENMEGAAFLAVCRAFGVPGAEVRAVSNYTDDPRSAWRIEESAEKLAKTIIRILSDYE
mgnify:CR=1 FL=1